ncbi:endonuclease/exonuclease/phosphatase family protein [Pedobacter sp. MC2016-14]|uniref:endonuclease/exonuclease/phosphatase family protein n=1 Tax=Pedobacter sp. MC2016-14 TaxID=2897327 RepID=UPI001E28C458|nr:endonuclease/exonuclease/phosphatase family protein [Pedobacter sp. MC2016-14]MCD0487901.1 endonuclease/exonuclease/phosphatase family protein [Pedobacter sp. MC2016-14]
MKKSKTTFFNKLLGFIAVILAISLILGMLAGSIDPRTNKYIPFFGLAYPYLLVLNVLTALFWLLRKRIIYAVLTVALIFAGNRVFIATFSFKGTEGAGPKKDTTLLRMMTYNVHNFKPYEPGNSDSVKNQILNLVRTEDPDVIAFQEYFTRKKGAFDLTDSLKRILKTKHYYFVPSQKNDYEAMGLAIFSKYAIKDKGTIWFDANHSGNSSIYVDLEVNKKLIRIYNVHLQSISFVKQDYEYLDKVKKKMDAEIVPSRRIIGMLKSAFLKRSAQVDLMKAHMKTCTSPYLIAGDFNDTPASYAVTQLTKSLQKTFVKKGEGFGTTYNGKFPNFQIDYIAVTKDIEVINHRVIEAKLSDHFPLRSDLRLTP